MAVGPQEIGPPRDRGSYRHMLDLVSSPNFEQLMNSLLVNTGASVSNPELRCPIGRGNASEWSEIDLESYQERMPLPNDAILDSGWWFPHKTNRNTRPTWDLLCPVSIQGEPGLLMVEGKAHVGEVKIYDAQTEPRDTPRSIANNLSIRLRVSKAHHALNALRIGKFVLSTGSHYQLVNRLAYLSKLSSLGVRTILLYLGWINSPDWQGADPFTTEQHWLDTMKQFVKGVVPDDFLEREFRDPSGGSIHMIVRSLAASEVSRTQGD